MTMPIKYASRDGKFSAERDFHALPESSQLAIATGGFAHELGNVVSSKVNSLIKGAVAGKGGKAADVTKDQVTAFRKENSSLVERWQREEFASALGEMDKGEMGTRESGPRLDPVTKEYNSLVLARANILCEGWGVKLPGAPKDGQPTPEIKFADGSTLTRQQLFDRIHNSKKPGNGADLHKQAEDIVAARNRVAARGTKAGEASSLENVF